MKKHYKEGEILHLKERTVFFDANIILSVFYTIDPNDWAQKNYSRVFAKLIENQNKIAFDVIIVSEVINRALRMEYKTYLRKNDIEEKNLSFKIFRDSESGKYAWQKIREMMRDVILPTFSVDEKSWNKDEIDRVLTQEGDFNDQLIANLCVEKNYVLLTNDADFRNDDLEVLSLNKVYFQDQN
jgi:predicted nucleic acid-binding protein